MTVAGWGGEDWTGRGLQGKEGLSHEAKCVPMPLWPPFLEGVDPQVLPIMAGFWSDRKMHRDYWSSYLNYLQSLPWKTDFSPNSYPARNRKSRTEHIISDCSLLPHRTSHIKPGPELLEHHVPFSFREVIAVQFVMKMKSPFITVASYLPIQIDRKSVV